MIGFGDADSENSPPLIRHLFARVKGYPQVSKQELSIGEAITIDGGDLGRFEITLTGVDVWHLDRKTNSTEFLVTRLRNRTGHS